MRVDGQNSRICGATNDSIDCFDLDTGNSFSIAARALRVNADADNVCWLDFYGIGSCTNVAVPNERLMDIQAQGIVYTLLYDTRALSQSSEIFDFPPMIVKNFSAGPAGVCVNSGSPFCSFTQPFVPMSAMTTIPVGFGGFNSNFFMQTSTVFWVDTAIQAYGSFGLPGCDGVTNPCVSISSEISITSGFIGGAPPFRIALGYQRGYAALIDGSLKCWGAAGDCPNYSNVLGVTAYNGGACALFATSATCFGDFEHTFLYDAFNCAPDDITITINSEIYHDLQCAACPLGSQFSNGTCSQCAPNFVRGRGANSCQICPNGFQANADQSACIQCLPYQYKSNTMLECLDCGLGSQSNGVACFACPNGYVRDASMTSCSLCPAGSVPAYSQTSCFSCESPAVWSGTWTTVSLFSYTTWTNGVCIDCPIGKYPTGFSCSPCDAPFYRTSQSECISCPDGYEPNSSRTICIPCEGNFVRTGPTPFCFECPGGIVNEEHTRCLNPSKPLFSLSQSALLAFGIMILLSTIVIRSHLSEAKFVAGISMGLFFIAFAFVFPATKTK